MSDTTFRALQLTEALAEATAEHARIADMHRRHPEHGYELRLDEARADLDHAFYRLLEFHREAGVTASDITTAWAETSARALR